MKLSNLFQKSAQPGKPLIAEYNSQQALAYQKQNLHQIHEAKSQMGTNSQGYRALRAISHVLESHRLWEQDPEIGANSIWLYTEGCQSALHILLEHQTAHITWLGSLNGTGRALLEKGLGQSMQRGATKATVKPIWESHGFYQKLGFQDQGNGSWQKPLRESTEDLDETSLEDLLGAIEHEQEQIDSASYGAEGESYQKLDKDFKALEAVSSVVKNNLKALKNPSLRANSIFLYNYTTDTGIFSVAAVHVAIEGSVAHVKWLGSYGKKPGSGKQLLLQALSEAKKMGATQTVVDAKWESDGFYQKQGYRALQPGKFNPFTGSNLVKMSRKLEEGWYKIYEDFSKRALYRYNYRGEKAEYNPDFFDLEDDSLEDEHGKSIATKDKLVPKPHLRHELNLTKNPNLVYRGMSNAEFQQIKKTGKIQSKGGYNLAGQEGLTYFSTDPNSAEFYAHAFAPWKHKANWDNPAWVVAINKPDPSRVVKVPGTGAHEVGVTGSVDASEIQEIYRGTAVQYHPGVPDQIAPSAWLHWEKVPLSMLTSHSSELQEKWTKKYKKSINCNAPKDLNEAAVQGTQFVTLNADQLKEALTFLEELAENINDESIQYEDRPDIYKKLERDYRAVTAVSNVMQNNLRALKNPKLHGSSIFLYDVDDSDLSLMDFVGAIHVVLHDDNEAEVKWIGSYDADGSGLLRAAMKIAKERGATSMKLDAKWDSEGFYHKMGFEQSGPSVNQPLSGSQLTPFRKKLAEKWTKKYKKSINCNAPKGFSQRAHCAARRKRRAGGTTKSKSVSENKMNQLVKVKPVTSPILYHGTLRDNVSKIQSTGLVPRVGQFTAGIYGQKAKPFVFAADQSNARSVYCALASNILKKIGHMPTEEEMTQHGALFVISRDAHKFRQYNPGGKRRLGSLEPGDYYSAETIKPDSVLMGDELLKWIKDNDADWGDMCPITYTTEQHIHKSRNLSEATKISKLLSMDPQTFDQTPQGWRSLVQGNNFEDAIQALKAYIKTYVRGNQFSNPPEGEEKWDSPGLLFWHLGQLLAMQNKYQQAAEWMTRSKNADDPDAEWDNYVDATLAFLKGDRVTLNKIAGEPNYNSNTIKKLAQGIGKSYQQVYEQQASGTLTIKSVSESRMDTLVESMLHNLQSQGLTEAEAVAHIDERLDEDLRKWFKQKWVRFGPDGKIRGACARGKDSEGKPKCLPQRKAWALGKKRRATAAARKRREDPNPERKGRAKNVATKESVGGTTLGSLCTIKTNFPEADFWLVRRGDRKNVGKPTKEFSPYHIGIKVTDVEKLMPQYLYYMMMHLHNQGYWLSRSMGTTALVNIRTEDVKNIQLALTEHELKDNSSCPHCGGHMVSHTLLNEKKDACYYKVKSRYKVWPSAYASGALVQCRKKGAKNWGNKGKKQ